MDTSPHQNTMHHDASSRAQMLREHADLAKIINHHAFYFIDPTPWNCDVALRHYLDFIPVTENDTAWYYRGDEIVCFSRNNQDTHWLTTNRNSKYLLNNEGDEYAVLSKHGEGLQQDVENHLARKHKFQTGRLRYALTTGSRLVPRNILEKLGVDSMTLYEFHTAYPTVTDLLEIDGIGKRTAVALKHQGQYHNHNTDNIDCVTAICPDCEATWKAPVFPDVPRRDVHSIAATLYCPVCQYNQLDGSHISPPQPFNPTQRVSKYNFNRI